MSDDGTMTWQPLSALPQIERDINEQFDNTRELYEHLCQGRDRPHLLDDALVERVLRHVADQVEFLPVYREQLGSWYRSQPTASQFLELDRVTHQLDRWEALLTQQRSLAEELSAGTIDKMMALSNEELAQGIFSGKIPLSVYGKEMNTRASLCCCDTLFRDIVLINDEEQYSLWPASNEIPAA